MQASEGPYTMAMDAGAGLSSPSTSAQRAESSRAESSRTASSWTSQSETHKMAADSFAQQYDWFAHSDEGAHSGGAGPRGGIGNVDLTAALRLLAEMDRIHRKQVAESSAEREKAIRKPLRVQRPIVFDPIVDVDAPVETSSSESHEEAPKKPRRAFRSKAHLLAPLRRILHLRSKKSRKTSDTHAAPDASSVHSDAESAASERPESTRSTSNVTQVSGKVEAESEAHLSNRVSSSLRSTLLEPQEPPRRLDSSVTRASQIAAQWLSKSRTPREDASLKLQRSSNTYDPSDPTSLRYAGSVDAIPVGAYGTVIWEFPIDRALQCGSHEAQQVLRLSKEEIASIRHVAGVDMPGGIETEEIDAYRVIQLRELLSFTMPSQVSHESFKQPEHFGTYGDFEADDSTQDTSDVDDLADGESTESASTEASSPSDEPRERSFSLAAKLVPYLRRSGSDQVPGSRSRSVSAQRAQSLDSTGYQKDSSMDHVRSRSVSVRQRNASQRDSRSPAGTQRKRGQSVPPPRILTEEPLVAEPGGESDDVLDLPGALTQSPENTRPGTNLSSGNILPSKNTVESPAAESPGAMSPGAIAHSPFAEPPSAIAHSPYAESPSAIAHSPYAESPSAMSMHESPDESVSRNAAWQPAAKEDGPRRMREPTIVEREQLHRRAESAPHAAHNASGTMSESSASEDSDAFDADLNRTWIHKSLDDRTAALAAAPRLRHARKRAQSRRHSDAAERRRRKQEPSFFEWQRLHRRPQALSVGGGPSDEDRGRSRHVVSRDDPVSGHDRASASGSSASPVRRVLSRPLKRGVSAYSASSYEAMRHGGAGHEAEPAEHEPEHHKSRGARSVRSLRSVHSTHSTHSAHHYRPHAYDTHKPGQALGTYIPQVFTPPATPIRKETTLSDVVAGLRYSSQCWKQIGNTDPATVHSLGDCIANLDSFNEGIRARISSLQREQDWVNDEISRAIATIDYDRRALDVSGYDRMRRAIRPYMFRRRSALHSSALLHVASTCVEMTLIVVFWVLGFVFSVLNYVFGLVFGRRSSDVAPGPGTRVVS